MLVVDSLVAVGVGSVDRQHGGALFRRSARARPRRWHATVGVEFVRAWSTASGGRASLKCTLPSLSIQRYSFLAFSAAPAAPLASRAMTDRQQDHADHQGLRSFGGYHSGHDTPPAPACAAPARAVVRRSASRRRVRRWRAPACRTRRCTSRRPSAPVWPRSWRSSAISTPQGCAAGVADGLDRLADGGAGGDHVVDDQHAAAQRRADQTAALAVVLGFLAVEGERHVAAAARPARPPVRWPAGCPCRPGRTACRRPARCLQRVGVAVAEVGQRRAACRTGRR